MTSRNSNNKSSRRVWRDPTNQTRERHYCALCNAWMASDRASILVHENGKQHKEKVEQQFREKRLQKQAQEKQEKLLQQSLQQMEAAAAAATATTSAYGSPPFYNATTTTTAFPRSNTVQQQQPQYVLPHGLAASHPIPSVSMSTLPSAQLPVSVPSSSPMPQPTLTQQPQNPPLAATAAPATTKQEWQAHKRKRMQEHELAHKRKFQMSGNEEGEEEPKNEMEVSLTASHNKPFTIAPSEGYYSFPVSNTSTGDGNAKADTVISNTCKRDQHTQSQSNVNTVTTTSTTTYLEGLVFGDILEEDMPVQVWLGHAMATAAEQRLPHQQHFWKDAIVVSVKKDVRAKQTNVDGPREDSEDVLDASRRILVDLVYLREKNSSKVKIEEGAEIVKSSSTEQDSKQEVEEAADFTKDKSNEDKDEEILLQGIPLNRIRIILGADESIPDTIEEARLLAKGGEVIHQDSTPQETDETTGLSGWSTVAVKRTTVRHEIRQERARQRATRRQAALDQARQEKEREARKMEEAKVANADDSALGAYDVWSRTKDGYKGVDIHNEAQVDVHELGKKLSQGQEKVGFKKLGKGHNKKKQNRRTTSADD